jgi:hypothetical protein
MMLPLALQAVGAVCVVVGVSLIFPPAGFIVGGAFLVIFGLAIERGR